MIVNYTRNEIEALSNIKGELIPFFDLDFRAPYNEQSLSRLERRFSTSLKNELLYASYTYLLKVIIMRKEKIYNRHCR